MGSREHGGQACFAKAQPVFEEIVPQTLERHSQETLPCNWRDQQRGSMEAGSNHSRLRRDLVNLNKGVVKWLVKEREGLLTRDEVVERIRNSAAARHLASVHGEQYKEA